MRLLYLGNILSKHGFTQTTIEVLGPQLEAEGFDIIYASNKRNVVFRMLHMLFVLIKNINKVDGVIIDTYSSFAFWYAYASGVICKMFKVPYYPILHGGSLPDRLKSGKRVCKQLFGNSKVNISPSNYLKHFFELEGFKVVTIGNNIDLSSYKLKKRTSFSPRLLWVRSFSVIYNPLLAIRVVEKLKKTYPKVELCMIGPVKDESYQGCVDLAKELGVEENVVFTGKMSKQQWHKKSEEYDIFINTTNFDNTPVSVIEALALGLPVVSTNVGGLPYMLENDVNAILVNPDDVDAMCNAILSIINDFEKTQQICDNGYELVRQLDWDVIKEKWKKLFGV